MTAIAQNLMAEGHPCKAQLVRWLGANADSPKALARRIGCEPSTARSYMEGRSWPGEAAMTAMVAEWGAAFLLYVFAPLTEQESPFQIITRATHEIALANKELSDLEARIARHENAARNGRPAARESVSLAHEAGEQVAPIEGTASYRLRRLAGACLGLLAAVTVVAGSTDDAFARAKDMRGGKPVVQRVVAKSRTGWGN